MIKNIFIFSSFLIFFCLPVLVYGQTMQSNEVQTRVGSPAANIGGSNPSGKPFYCQGDPQWGNRCSLAAAGCGPTSMAMVLSSYGDAMTPPEVDAIFNQREWRACADVGSSMSTAITTYLPERGYIVESINTGGKLNLQKAKEFLEAGYTIIGSVSIHIFVVDAVDIANDTVTLRDPADCIKGNGVVYPNAYPWRGYPWYYGFAVKKK